MFHNQNYRTFSHVAHNVILNLAKTWTKAQCFSAVYPHRSFPRPYTVCGAIAASATHVRVSTMLLLMIAWRQSPHMTPVHTKIRDHPENLKNEKFIHTPTQDGNLQSLLPSFTGRVKVKRSRHRPWRYQEVEAPRFIDNRHMQVVRMSALRTGRLYLPGNIPGTHFCYRLSRPQGHRAVGRIKSMANSNDTIENRTRDFPACSARPQPTALRTAPLQEG
jgi:hypothetical protein